MKVVFLRPKVVFAGHEGRLRLTGLVVFLFGRRSRLRLTCKVVFNLAGRLRLTLEVVFV